MAINESLTAIRGANHHPVNAREPVCDSIEK
jgi:hypothetical protein